MSGVERTIGSVVRLAVAALLLGTTTAVTLVGPALAVGAGFVLLQTGGLEPGAASTVELAVGAVVGLAVLAVLVVRSGPGVRRRLRHGPERLVLGRPAAGSGRERTAAKTLAGLARQVDRPLPALRVVESDAALCYSVHWPVSGPDAVGEGVESAAVTRADGGAVERGSDDGWDDDVGVETVATPLDRSGPELPAPLEAAHVVVLSTGLLAALDPSETRAVLAHEVAHLEHADLRIVGWLLLPLYWARDLVASARSAPRFYDRGRLDEVLLRGVARVVGPVSWLAVAVVTRGRELAADDGAVAITGDPAALASALERLSALPSAPTADARTVAAVNVLPQTRPGDGWFDRLTHPKTAARIERLRANART